VLFIEIYYHWVNYTGELFVSEGSIHPVVSGLLDIFIFEMYSF
jgi:hypothetical protein